MKNSVLFFIAIFALSNLHPQTDKGKKFVNAQLSVAGYNNSNGSTFNSANYSTRSFNFQFVPSLGYFVKDNFALGANLNLEVFNTDQKSEYHNQAPSVIINKSNAISYGVGGFARYYKRITDNFFVVPSGGIVFKYQTEKSEYSNNDPNYILSADNPAVQNKVINGISVGLTPGIVYFISPKFGIETNFGNIRYQNSRARNLTLPNTTLSSTSSYGINFSLTTFFLGLNYYF